MFDLASSMMDLGYHVRLGKQISAIPDPEYPWDPDIVRKIRSEFDPSWTPLFCRELWMSPNKGFVITARHMVARHVAIPKADVDVLPALTSSQASWWGIQIKTPVLECMTLETRLHDGECECESCVIERSCGGMVRRDLGGYVPFDDRIYLTCRAMWNQNHTKRIKDLVREVTYLQCDKPKEASAAAMNDLRDELKSDWKWLERKREAETEYDIQRASAPAPTRPSVGYTKTAGSTPAIGAA